MLLSTSQAEKLPPLLVESGGSVSRSEAADVASRATLGRLCQVRPRFSAGVRKA